MLATALYMLQLSLQNRLSVVSMIGLRCGMSFYAGWLTVAVILNVAFLLKSFGVSEADMGIDESMFAVVILSVGCCIYMLGSYFMRNPLYAAIYIWALFGIRDLQSSYANITLTTEVLLIVNGCYIVGLTIWLILDKINNTPNEKTGLFY